MGRCEAPEKYWDIDTQKQKTIHVEYKEGKVTVPSVSSEKLKAMHAEVFRALSEVKDLPYSGVTYESTDISQWQASKDVESVGSIYGEVLGL